MRKNMTTTTEHTLRAADFDFRVRVYHADAPSGPVLVWLHGGGFIFGTIDMPEADYVARRLSEDGITVASVDYTLAPYDALKEFPSLSGDHTPEEIAAYLEAAGPRAPYPAAAIQSAAAVSWAHENASSWGGDPSRVSIGGASAGGTLAASAAARFRDSGDVKLASLLLVYPHLHSELPEPDEELQALLDQIPAEARMPPGALRAINEGYLAGASSDEVYAFPGGHDMRGMPRTLIVNAESDELRPSGEAFAAELALGGVDVEVIRERGTQHGYLNGVGEVGAEQTLAHMRRVLTAD